MHPIKGKMKLTILSFLLFFFLSHTPQPAASVPRRWHNLKHIQVNAAANTEPAASPWMSSSKSIAVPPESAEASSFTHKITSTVSGWFKGSMFGGRTVKQPNLAPAPAPAPGVHAAPITTDPALEQICKATSYPELCIKSISPLISGKVDAMSALQAAVKACDEQIKLAIAVADKLADSQQTRVCKNQYKDAVENIKGAYDAIKSKDMGTLKTMLGAIIADASTCDDSFHGADSPLADVDGIMSDMASNSLAIAALVKW